MLKEKEEKKMLKLVCCLSASAALIFAAAELYAYKQMHYDREAAAYVLSSQKFAEFKESSNKLFDVYYENGYHSETDKEWFALSEAKLCLDKEVKHEDSCIEWFTERGRRVGVQYTWDEGNETFYSKVYYCNYNENKYPSFKLDNGQLVEVASRSIHPG